MGLSQVHCIKQKEESICIQRVNKDVFFSVLASSMSSHKSVVFVFQIFSSGSQGPIMDMTLVSVESLGPWTTRV